MQEHDMARSFGSMDTMTMRQDQCAGINRTTNGESVDPTLRKWSLVDPSLSKLDSIDLLATGHSQDATTQQDETNICKARHDKRDSLGLNLTVTVQEEESKETKEQVEQRAN